jgi:CHRD domain
MVKAYVQGNESVVIDRHSEHFCQPSAGPRLAERIRTTKEPSTMNRLVFSAFVFVFAASACTDSPSGPSEPQPTLSAELLASNEVPPITNAESTGSGNATVTFDLRRDSSGNITAASVTFVVNLRGFPAGTPIRIAHIHPGAAGVNGPVLLDTTLAPSDNLTLTNGSGSFTKANVTTTPAIAAGIIANPSAYYFNAHSALNPGGVVRGQLVRVQ